ncbi:hypothetical protein DOY81_000840 [Sarcophaga bullata]|nr:hypothetical protein DOY81_000840 [Sarcophaga bullata]
MGVYKIVNFIMLIHIYFREQCCTIYYDLIIHFALNDCNCYDDERKLIPPTTKRQPCC